MRTFIAIDLEKEVKNKIMEIQKILLTTNCDVKWVEYENLHITIKFLGETPEEKIPSVESILSNISRNIKKFAISIENISTFPENNNPKVIWCGISNGSENLKILYENIENELSKINFPRDNRLFTAHITIGRVKSTKNIKILIKKINETRNILFGENKVNSVILLKSELTYKGPIYTKINRFQLCE